MKIPKFKREQVDLSTLNYKELMNYRLNVIIKMITSAFYTLLFNSIVGLSFASLIKQHIDGNILGDVGTYSSYAMCGLGALLTNGGVLAFHIMSSKPKVNKSVTNNNMPVFRLNKLGLVFIKYSH